MIHYENENYEKHPLQKLFPYSILSFLAWILRV